MVLTKSNNSIWFEEPATVWEEALPVGNGRMGAMVFGGTFTERIQLNEDSIWYGAPIDRNNRSALENLETLREYIRKGEVSKAEALAKYAFSGVPQSQRMYQTLGDIQLLFHGIDDRITDYKRSLDFESGIVETRFTNNETQYVRRVFISYPDQIMVIHIAAEGKTLLNFDCLLDRRRALEHAGAIDERTIYIDGQCGSGGTSFYSALHCHTTDGQVSTIGEHLLVRDASEVLLIFDVATSFRVKNIKAEVIHKFEHVRHLSFHQLLERHQKDYFDLMNSCNLEIEDEEHDQLATDKRLKLLQNGTKAFDNTLISLLFNYGRYLLITSSRPGSLPANLQGRWCDGYMPPWDSKYTININTQMNYWPAETTGLSQCHLPLFDHIERMKVNGKVTAQVMYGCRGFVAHHNTDLYGDTAPQDHYLPATYWVLGAAWLCLHIFERYRFTLDKSFLENHYDTIKEATLFLLDFMTINHRGNYVLNPTVSPENTYFLDNGSIACLCEGCSMDTQIIGELFEAFTESARILGVDTELCQEVLDVMEKLPKVEIGKHGQIMEWCEDYEEQEPGHRHISQLFGLYPGHLITKEKQDLFAAAKKTLQRRLEHGGGHTGWSRAWIIGLFARLMESDKAIENLNAFLKESVFSNLMDKHPWGEGAVFQIDGNFGTTAAIVEMLVQSHSEYIDILPALPKQFASGTLNGVRIRGGSILHIRWRNHQLIKCEVESLAKAELKFRYKDVVQCVELKAGEKKSFEF